MRFSLQLNVSPELELLIDKRLSSGAYASAQGVIRRALEDQEASKEWEAEERRMAWRHTEQRVRQAEAGELIAGADALEQILCMKDALASATCAEFVIGLPEFRAAARQSPSSIAKGTGVAY